MAKTKIVVIQLKEIIYTVIFAALGILLILLLIFMFRDKGDKTSTDEANIYTPGKYNSSITLNNMAYDIEVVVDKSHINSVEIVNIDEAVTTMYPLIEPSLEAITTQLYNDVPIEEVELQEDSQYTQQILLDAIQDALDLALVVTE
ncbi:MAG: hypothetical protein QM644_14450 [Mobilitalea sp.]